MSDAFSPPPSPPGSAPEDDKILVIVGHIFAIVALILWLVHKDNPEKAYLVDQAKESVNFAITIILISIVMSIIGAVPILGWIFAIFAFPLFALAIFVLIVMAVISVTKGNAHRYPFALRLIK
ncbi:DUF4870 domain-containing protein [Silanimonas sp.]|jgi:uncharacterized Tic20 family protein|uniref:DUF4870 domain-containing protein n=1 Tax=Silanimonas sp. TaxID=1929290 RepID=UPI0037CA3562